MPRSFASECDLSSKSQLVEASCIEIERRSLRGLQLFENVVRTLLKAINCYTKSAYHRVCKSFLWMTAEEKCNPLAPSVSKVLDLLQNDLESGLAYNSLRVQVSDILAMLNNHWAFNPLVIRFLKAAVKIRPPMKSYFPKWDLTLVLKALLLPPFEPLSSCSLLHLTLRSIFYIAIASASRVSELCASSVKEPYCLLLQNRTILRPMPSFLPKVSTSFHLNWETIPRRWYRG